MVTILHSSAFLITVVASVPSLQLSTDHLRLAMAEGHKGMINKEALGVTGEHRYSWGSQWQSVYSCLFWQTFRGIVMASDIHVHVIDDWGICKHKAVNSFCYTSLNGSERIEHGGVW